MPDVSTAVLSNLVWMPLASSLGTPQCVAGAETALACAIGDVGVKFTVAASSNCMPGQVFAQFATSSLWYQRYTRPEPGAEPLRGQATLVCA